MLVGGREERAAGGSNQQEGSAGLQTKCNKKQRCTGGRTEKASRKRQFTSYPACAGWVAIAEGLLLGVVACLVQLLALHPTGA